jgi:hypothetical protein
MAYVDPTSGSVMLQIAAAGALTALFTARTWWDRVKHLARSGWERLRRP